ncbi:ABC transporter ATP-binding protein [Streptomyces paradoxus]|uniref:ABC transporter ATP-binding protein n=1 Tax=Streptomyces paradoxus TaxID=66375 RepID=UPI0037D8AF7A
MRNEKSEAVRLASVRKHYGSVTALDGIDATFSSGEFTAVMGPSGSGKSTFLHCAAGLENPTSGVVELAGHDVSKLSETQLARFRRAQVGFVFQAFNLLSALTVEQNVALPLRLAGTRPDRRRIDHALARVGLTARRRHRPAQLSGGQQQRVAVARALVTRPAVVFADEPTGALDTASAAEVLGLLRESVEEEQLTVIMVTHDPVAASYADRVVFLADGRVADEMSSPTSEEVAHRMTHLGAWNSRPATEER